MRIVSSFITSLTKLLGSPERQTDLRCSYFQTPSSWPSGGSRILSMLAQSERMFCWMYCREKTDSWFYSFLTMHTEMSSVLYFPGTDLGLTEPGVLSAVAGKKLSKLHALLLK